MIRDPQKVRQLLYEKCAMGKDPRWNLESAEEYGIDWQVLEEREFDAIKSSAQKPLRLAA